MVYKLVEKEVFGVDYERYSLLKLIEKLVRKYKIKSVLEIPAAGVKAMPSIYSLGFGQAGCNVTLVNVNEKSKRIWRDFKFKVNFVDIEDITKTGFKDNQFDFVWNFAIFPELNNRMGLLREMKRVARSYVCIFAINGYNIGSQIHQLLHKLKGIPWTHGDKKLMYYQNLRKLFLKSGLQVERVGVMDTPPWPDSVGFRDLRLHKMKIDFKDVRWDSNTIRYMKTCQYPFWMKLVYDFEKIPMPFFVKLLYSHIYFVFGEVT